MFNWQEYHILASNLLAQADNSEQKEAVLRSAVSRAYYAAFHAASDYLKASGMYPSTSGNNAPGESSHKRVVDTFKKNVSNPTLGKIGRLLGRLKNDRQWADYNPWDHAGVGAEFKDSEAIAEKIKNAEEIIRLIKSLHP
jgi:uncharacterized protein (UPF0332 family)